MSETKFGAWAVPQTNVAIEYSLVVIEEIRQAVTEGFQRFARGGIEVGGVLYGTYDGNTARILAMREIACEHAHGPSFVLSDKDRAALTDQMERDKLDVRLEGFQALGLYVSHTRSEIVLQKSDQETYEAFFPELWQVALVVKPGRAGTMRAGFFVREVDGTVKTDSSHLDFNFPDRIAMPQSERASLDRGARERPSAGDRRGIAPFETAAGPGPVDPVFPQQGGILFPGPEPGTQQARAPEYMPYPDKKRNWQSWAITAVVVLVLAFTAGIGLRYYSAHAPAEPISLSVYEHDGQLRIEWNHNAAPIRNAARGSLEIVDGKDTKTLLLSPQELQRGSFTYARQSGDVQVRLEAQNASGEKTQEASRFLGAVPHAADAVDPNEADTVRLERDALKDEVTRLRTENAAQATRIQQLERTLAILRLRLGIQAPDKQ